MITLRPPLHENFEMPTRDELLEVAPGNVVKLIFDMGDTAERMWVIVTNCSDNDEWHGVLDNEPFSTDGSEYGMSVVFHPYDVIDIHPKDEETQHWADDRFCGLN